MDAKRAGPKRQSTSYLAASLLVVLAACSTTTALAQTAPETSAPVVQSSTDVPYPEGASGDASVLLELVVEADGSVSSAVAIEGVEPFAEQARRNALAWKLVPALRDGTPVPARIRARVEFREPKPSDAAQPSSESLPTAVSPTPNEAAPPPAVPPTPAAPTATGAATDLQVPADATELTFGATAQVARHDAAQTTLSASDSREMPGAFGDPFRAIEALPGVTPLVSGMPYFYVRGAPPNDNGYFLDGIRVPLLFHVGVAQSVIHPALIDHVDFYPSAAPASFGRYTGAIIAGQTRDQAASLHGEANLRLFDAGALVEAPFGDGRGSALVAGRYGYPGPILSAISSDIRLGYWDYQARASWRFGDSDTLGILAVGSHDYLASLQVTVSPQGTSRRFVEQLASDFHRIDLRYDHATSGGHVRVAATLGYDSQGGGGGDDMAPPVRVTDPSAAVRLEIDQELSSEVRIRGGADARADQYGFEQRAADSDQQDLPASANPPPKNITAGAHADVVWRVTPRVEVVPGARLDVYDSARDSAPDSSTQVTTVVPAVDPRLAARVMINDDVAWLSALGLVHQYPTLRAGSVPAPILSVPGFPTGESHLQSALQASQGVEIALPADVTLTTSGFLSYFRDLTDFTATCMQLLPAMVTTPAMMPPPGPYVCPDSDPVPGHAYGLELLLRRPFTKRLSGWLTYTLSRSMRKAHFVTPTGQDAVAKVPSEGDRTHVLSAVLAYDLGRSWRAGGRFVFYTGQPYSALEGNVPVPPYNSRRLPPFFRVDLRLEKRWQLGQNGWIAFLLEGQNVTLSKESSMMNMSCVIKGEMNMGGSGATQRTRCTTPKIGPVTIPSVGVEAGF